MSSLPQTKQEWIAWLLKESDEVIVALIDALEESFGDDSDGSDEEERVDESPPGSDEE